jgi:hypothetical protein
MKNHRSFEIWSNFGLTFLITFVICLLPTSSSAQISFKRTYGGPFSDEGYCVRETADGGYILSGRTVSGIGGDDLFLVRTDSLGDTLWTNAYGDTLHDHGYSIQVTSDKGFIITGCTGCFPASPDVYLVKTDSLGNEQWTKTYGDSLDDVGYHVQQTKDGGYIITGLTYSFGAGLQDVYLIKTDSLGDTLWTRTYGGIFREEGHSVQQTVDGGYIIAGWTSSFGAGFGDVYLVRTDFAGNIIWSNTFGGIDWEKGYSIQQTSDLGYILSGYTESFSVGMDDVYLVKTDTGGSETWAKSYGGTGTDWGYSVQETSDGGYILTGFTGSFGAGMDDVWLVKTNSSGDSLWSRTFGGGNNDGGQFVRQTTDGGYIIVGSYGSGTGDVYLIKTDGNGLVGVEEERDEYRMTNIEFRLSRNYPNPFHSSTTISYQIPTSNPASRIPYHVSLNIYDLSGRLIETLVDEHQEPGVYKLPISNYQLPGSGVYFYRLQSGNYTATRKLILLR